MRASKRYIVHQLPSITAFLRTAAAAARSSGGGAPLQTPTPVLVDNVGPRPNKLIDDYVRHCGGERGWYKGTVPAHLFSQWSFPVLSKTLLGIPYDMKKVLNGGCRMEMNAPIPRDEPITIQANIEDIDDNGRRAVIHQRIVTSTPSAPDALVSHMYAIVPLKRDKSKKGPKKEKPRVPDNAREVGAFEATPQTAMDFAILTGDFNPVHWIPPYARAAGFKNTILHGFATLGLTIETLNRAIWAGDPQRASVIDVKFTRPLVLPNRVRIYVDDAGSFAVGDAPGGPAYLTGTYETRVDS